MVHTIFLVLVLAAVFGPMILVAYWSRRIFSNLFHIGDFPAQILTSIPLIAYFFLVLGLARNIGSDLHYRLMGPECIMEVAQPSQPPIHNVLSPSLLPDSLQSYQHSHFQRLVFQSKWKLIQREGFFYGQRMGLSQRWHPNGKMAIETSYFFNEEEGWRQEWHTNGQRSRKVMMDDGKPDGPDSTWYDNGHREETGRMVEGKREGKWKSWNPYGKNYSTSYYRKGELATDPMEILKNVLGFIAFIFLLSLLGVGNTKPTATTSAYDDRERVRRENAAAMQKIVDRNRVLDYLERQESRVDHDVHDLPYGTCGNEGCSNEGPLYGTEYGTGHCRSCD